MEKLINELNAAQDLAECKLIEGRSKKFGAILNSYTANEIKNIDKLLLAVIRNGNREVMDNIADPIVERRKAIDWKNRPELVIEIVDLVKQCAVADSDKQFDKNYLHLVEKLIATLQSNHILDKHFGKIFEIVELAMVTNIADSPIHKAASPCLADVPWNEYLPQVARGTELVVPLVKQNWNVESAEWVCTTAESFLCCAYRCLSRDVTIVKEIGSVKTPAAVSNVSDLYSFASPFITELVKFCAAQEWATDEPGKKNMCHSVLKSIMENVLANGDVDPLILKPIMPDIKELWTSGDEIMERDAGYIIETVAAKDPSLIDDLIDTLLDMFLKGKLDSLISALTKLYEYAPTKIESRLDGLVAMMQVNETNKYFILPLLMSMAKLSPKAFQSNHIDGVVSFYNDPNFIHMVNNVLESLATSRPEDVLKHESAILQVVNRSPENLSYTANLLAKLSTDKSRAVKYVNLFAGQLAAPIDSGVKINFLVNMRTIALAHAEEKLLDSHRALIKRVMAQSPSLKDYCQSLIDTIEERSLETVSTEVATQKQNVTKLDTKVTETQQDVKQLGANVKDTQKTVVKVKSNVEQQAVRIECLEETVDETIAKVEVIDKKTLSHAPKWSAAVSKLLNDYAEHDWRSLATRLGYSNNDIRNWATQADPCLSLLDDWFATHKTREATYAVHHVLADINRTDAAGIVEEALKAAENVVLDDDDADERKAQSKAQAIFLSYQWAHQKHVKILKRHLEQAGYAAWMDIGQMGGGDKLYAKIDAAMRAAKVVVCCVTDKYAQSMNCNREVTLAVTLGKPIIPILLEESRWPPAGALGPIFSEYLYIQFFRRPQDQDTSPKASGDKYNDKFWLDAKFSELLMQLRYTHSPDTKLIAADSLYKNWWNPPEEIVVIDAKPQTNSRQLPASSSSSDKNKSEAWQVFISYQWDVQTVVKQLYKRLTELGYKCWLDVMEMGGRRLVVREDRPGNTV